VYFHSPARPVFRAQYKGTIKQRVNVRMKRSGARWLAKHVGPFVELLAVSDSAEWSEFWINMAA
jgi:hypothetical protein